eukprot:7633949-Pyramimonas_sp.AAC.1
MRARACMVRLHMRHMMLRAQQRPSYHSMGGWNDLVGETIHIDVAHAQGSASCGPELSRRPAGPTSCLQAVQL